MPEKIEIQYQSYLPKDLVSKFWMLEFPAQSVSITFEKREPETVESFEAAPLTDIVIYINQHGKDLAIGGLLINFTYDILKGILKFFWERTTQYWSDVLKRNRSKTNHSRRISLNLKNSDASVEILFEGDVTEKEMDIVIDKAIHYLISDKLDGTLSNPDFYSSLNRKPEIVLRYNRKSGAWEPENFGNYRRKSEQRLKRMWKDFPH
jgi:hypothetical protein